MDDDYAPTVSERKKMERLKREERERERKERLEKEREEGGAGGSRSGESAMAERTRVLKSRRESLISKITETDGVCGCQSFVLMVAADREGAFYYGDEELVSAFFGGGLSRHYFDRAVNVRPFDPSEEPESPSTCCVPHCLVTRNSLPKWRQVAVAMYGFPASLPITLHVCPDDAGERERWVAELDLDPALAGVSGNKVVVCSLHFKEGFPSERHPYPTELLREPKTTRDNWENLKKIRFGDEEAKAAGKKEEEEVKVEKEEEEEEDGDVKPAPVSAGYKQLSRKGGRLRTPKSNKAVMRLARKRRLEAARRGRLAKPPSEVAAAGRRLLSRALKNRLGASIVRRGRVFASTRSYYEYIVTEYLKGEIEQVKKKEEDDHLEEDKGKEESQQQSRPQPAQPPSQPSVPKYPKIPSLSLEEKRRCLSTLYPPQPTKTMNPRKKYLCAVCKSTCDLFGLFAHMKRVHKGLLCQYCLKLFKRVPELEAHLRSAHQARPEKITNSQTNKTSLFTYELHYISEMMNLGF